MKQKIEGHTELVKDSDTGVICNRAESDRQRYINMKRTAQANVDSQSEIRDLKAELNELKTLVQQLLQK